MNKAIAAGAVLLLVSGTQLSYAESQHTEQEVQRQSLQRDWAISGYIGIADFDGDERPDPYRSEITHELSSDNAFKFGIILSKYYRDFSFNLGIEYMQEVPLEDEYGNELADHSHIPVSLGVNYHFDTSIIDPYIGAGVGYSFNDFSDSEFISRQGIRAEVDNSMFYFLTAGVEYPVNDRYVLFLAGQYTIGEVDMTGTVATPFGVVEMEDEGALDRYEFNVGVKYFF